MIKIEITLKFPNCLGIHIVKNGTFVDSYPHLNINALFFVHTIIKLKIAILSYL
jgi:hypothetical protein